MEKQTLLSYYCDLSNFEDVLSSLESTEYYHDFCGKVNLKEILFMDTFDLCSYNGESGYYFHIVFASYLETSYKVVIRIKCPLLSPSPLQIMDDLCSLLIDLKNKSFRYMLPCFHFSSDCEINNKTNSTPNAIL